MMDAFARENLEVDLLLEALYECHGYDFRHYARASVTRRLRLHAQRMERPSISALIPLVLHDQSAYLALVHDLSITVTEMFRDPTFYRALQEDVFPFLETFPFFNIWHAGCATGEEVYSLAILLQEAGLYDRAQIYATDFNEAALNTAKKRIYPLRKMKGYSTNYLQAGGRRSLADYYHAQYDGAILAADLQKNITFANHNLVMDGVFGQMHLIFCRNVLIYFNETLQNRVLTLFRESLAHRGFLCLGRKETLRFSEVEEQFDLINQAERIYQHHQ